MFGGANLKGGDGDVGGDGAGAEEEDEEEEGERECCQCADGMVQVRCSAVVTVPGRVPWLACRGQGERRRQGQGARCRGG